MVGLYVDPPEWALVLCVDEKGQDGSAFVRAVVIENEVGWLKPRKRRRFHYHFTPTSGSWLNQVERWFGLITDKMVRRGTFHSVDELERTADVILDKVRRCKESIVKN